MSNETHSPEQRAYRFHWRDGKVQVGKGYDVAHAFTTLGYGHGALQALDYWEPVKDEDHIDE